MGSPSTRLSQPADTVAGVSFSVLVVRHGQSEWNADGRWQGQSESPLSELGRAQARAATAAVGAVDAIVASDLERAATTAAIIAEGTGIGPVLTDHRLRERHAGSFEGLTRDEIEAAHPGHLASGRRPPGWESDASVQERVLAALDDLAVRTPDGEVLVVAHGGVIYALESHFGLDHERIANLAGRWFRHDHDGWALGDRTTLLPDDAVVEIPDIL